MIHYTLSPTPEQVDVGARMVDESGQIKNPLKLKRFHKSRVIAIALNEDGEVVGVGAVKKGSGPVAEVCNLTVRTDHRRRGIAFRLLELRIEESKRLGIELLWSKAKPDNAASIALVRSHHFRDWGKFVKGDGSGSPTLYFYLPLSLDFDWEAGMCDVTRGRMRLDS